MATCAECVHVEVCKMHYRQKCELTYESEREVEIAMCKAQKAVDIECEQFKDRSLVVVLPCKVGDTLYTVVRGYKIREWIVTDICFSDYLPISVMGITARDKRNSEHIRFADHYIGKTVFLTREAVEQALKECEKNAN